MSEVENIPQLRFPEFGDDWKEKPYGENYRFLTTNSFSRDKLNYDFGEVKNIHYGDIHTKFKTLFDMSIETVPFINDDVDISRIDNDNYCQVGDLVVADASEDYGDIGKTIEIVNLDLKKTLAGLHTFLARPMGNSISIGFMGNLLKSWKVRKQVMTVAQGSKVLGLSKTNLSKIKLSLPTKPEQQKIAAFLTAVDTKIEQLSKKQELLGEYKKGLMQQIFSQIIRFKADDGCDFPDWEEKKLGDVSIRGVSNISANQLEDNNGDYKIYGATGHLKNIDFYTEEDCYVAIVKDGAGAGRIMLLESKTSVLGTLAIIKAKQGNDINFLYWLIRTINFRKYIVGSTIPHIYYRDYQAENLKIPSLSEQTKIANFLSSIDSKIEQVGKQLDESKQFKKALLQQMFV